MSWIGEPYTSNMGSAALGEPTSWADVVSATFASTRAADNSNARSLLLEQAYDDRISAIESAGIRDHGLLNPMRLRNANVDGMAPGSFAALITPQTFFDDFDRRLHELGERNPEQRAVFRLDRSVREEAMERARLAEERTRNMLSRYGGSAPAFTASLAGGMGGAMYDPINLLSLGAGPWGRVGLGARQLLWMGVKTGAVNAGAETAIQPSVQAWRREAGLDYGASQAALNIASAFGFGAAADLGIRGGFRAVAPLGGLVPRLDAAGRVEGWMRPRAADAEWRDQRGGIFDPHTDDAGGVVGYRARLPGSPAPPRRTGPLSPERPPPPAGAPSRPRLPGRPGGDRPEPEAEGPPAQHPRVDDDAPADVHPPLLEPARPSTRATAEDALEEAATRLPGEHPVNRARGGDLEALDEVTRDAGLADRSEIRGARQTADVQSRLPDDASPFIDEMDRADRFLQALRNATDESEPLPRATADPVMPARRGYSDLRDDAPAPPSHYVIDYRPVTFRQIPAREVESDAGVFQFKGATDRQGVALREGLLGVTQWDPLAAGRVLVFEGRDGRFIIADGHQRLALAKRLEATGHPPINLAASIFREADGWQPASVRALAAKKNLQEGRADVIDAATILRERPDVLDGSVPLTSHAMRQARALARLSSEAWARVVSGQVAPNHAALVGQLVEPRAMHAGILDTLAKVEPRNEREVRNIISDLTQGPREEVQHIMLGGDPGRALIGERASVLDQAIRLLKEDAGIFALLTREAPRIMELGNVLKLDANADRVLQSETVQAIIETLAARPGPVRDWLTEAAREAAQAGGGRAAVRRSAQQFADRVRTALEESGIDAIRPHEMPPLNGGHVIDEPAGEAARAQVAELEATLQARVGKIMRRNADRALRSYVEQEQVAGLPALIPLERNLAIDMIADGEQVRIAVDRARAEAAGQIEAMASRDADIAARTAERVSAEAARPATERQVPDADIQSIVAMWRFVEDMRHRPLPERLTNWLVATGGVLDEGSEITNLIGAVRQRPGLISRTGSTLDDVVLRAWEQGFLSGVERPTISDLLDALADDLRDFPVVRARDAEALESVRVARELENDLAEFGIVGAKTEADVRRQVAERNQRLGELGRSAERLDSGPPRTGEDDPLDRASLRGPRSNAEADLEAREQITAEVQVGKAVDVDPLVTDSALRALETMVDLLPRDERTGETIQLGVPMRVEARNRGFDPTVHVTYKAPDGSTFSVQRRWSFFERAAALYMPEVGAIVVNRFGGIFSGDATHGFQLATRGELWHELVHALRANNVIDARVWDLLVRHADRLRILEMPRAEFRRWIGETVELSEEDIALGLHKQPLRRLYEAHYGHLDAWTQIRNEEAVAHMVQLIYHGAFSETDLAPIRPFLTEIFNGRAEHMGRLLQSNDPRVAVNFTLRRVEVELSEVNRTRKDLEKRIKTGEDSVAIADDLSEHQRLNQRKTQLMLELLVARRLAAQLNESKTPSHRGQPMFSLLGRKGAMGDDLLRLNAAQLMEAAGRAPAEIWRETRWYRDAAGNWVSEIADAGARLGTAAVIEGRATATTAGQALIHPQLWAAYPELAQIKSVFKPPRKGAADFASADLEGGIITIQSRSPRAARKSLLHEIQHFIQRLEGLPEGGTPESAMAAVRQLTADTDRQAASTLEMIGALEGNAGREIERLQLVADLARLKTVRTELDALTAVQAYERLAGEVSARNVERRSRWTQEMLDRTRPRVSEDLPGETQIIAQGPARQYSGGDWEDEAWAEFSRRAHNIEQAVEQREQGVARPPSARQRETLARQDRLGRDAEKQLKEVAAFERQLLDEGKPLGEVAAAIEAKFGFPVDATALARREVWWHIDQIVKRNWTPERVRQLQDLFNAMPPLRQVDIAARLGIAEDAVQRKLGALGMRRRRTTRADTPAGEKAVYGAAAGWSREQWAEFERLNAAGISERAIGDAMSDFTGQPVERHHISYLRKRDIRRGLIERRSQEQQRGGGGHEVWTAEQIAALTSDEVATLSAAQAARLLNARPEFAGREVTRNVVIGKRRRLSEQLQAELDKAARLGIPVDRILEEDMGLPDRVLTERQRAESGIIEMWKAVDAARRTHWGNRLVSYLIREGGLADEGGQVARILGSPKKRPGLISKRGAALDVAAMRAWKAGYLQGAERPSVEALLDAITEDLRGRPIVRSTDTVASADAADLARMEAELERYGIAQATSEAEATRLLDSFLAAPAGEGSAQAARGAGPGAEGVLRAPGDPGRVSQVRRRPLEDDPIATDLEQAQRATDLTETVKVCKP